YYAWSHCRWNRRTRGTWLGHRIKVWYRNGCEKNNNKKFIHIKFTLGEKKFIFPDAFYRGFLEME
ncbi:MAG: hypothetical protein U0K35_09530, partial [Prevotella sp.]|nr:hypothetical protein [Prevotella sp.]